MTARAGERTGQNMTAGTAMKTWQLGQDSRERIVGTGQLVQGSWDMAAETEENSQNMKTKKEQLDRTTGTGQPVKDSLEGWDRTAGTS
jgi:hypothetical protein